MFTPNKELLQQIMVQYLKESYPDVYTSDESFQNDIDPEHIQQANDFVTQLSQDPDAETKFADIASSLGYEGDLQDNEMIIKGAKGAKLKMLKNKTKKCSCGCNMITVKGEGGKLISSCACKCGGKVKKKTTPKKRIGGEINKLQLGGYLNSWNVLNSLIKLIPQKTYNTTVNTPTQIKYNPRQTAWDNTSNSIKNSIEDGKNMKGIVNIPGTTSIVGKKTPAIQPQQPQQRVNRYANVGAEEKARVTKWQSENGLKADGIWGPKTQAMYESLIASGKIGKDGKPINVVNTPHYENKGEFEKSLKINPAYTNLFNALATPPQSEYLFNLIDSKKQGGRIKKNQVGDKIQPAKPKPTLEKKKITPKQGKINNALPKNDGDEYSIPIGNNKDDNNKIIKKSIKKEDGGKVPKRIEKAKITKKK